MTLDVSGYSALDVSYLVHNSRITINHKASYILEANHWFPRVPSGRVAIRTTGTTGAISAKATMAESAGGSGLLELAARGYLNPRNHLNPKEERRAALEVVEASLAAAVRSVLFWVHWDWVCYLSPS